MSAVHRPWTAPDNVQLYFRELRDATTGDQRRLHTARAQHRTAHFVPEHATALKMQRIIGKEVTIDKRRHSARFARLYGGYSLSSSTFTALTATRTLSPTF